MKNIFFKIAVISVFTNTFLFASKNDSSWYSFASKKNIVPAQYIKLSEAIPYDVMNKNLIQSAELFKRAIELADSLKQEESSAALKRKLSIVYYFLSEYELSVKLALEAIKYYEKNERYVDLGEMYAGLGYQMKRRDLKKAFEYMHLGINYLNKQKATVHLIGAYNNFGVLYEMKGDLDSALYYYNVSLQLAENLKDSVSIPYSLNNIAGVYVMKKDFEKALPFYKRAFEIRMKRNDLNGISENYTYMGDWYYAQKKYNEAISDYLKGYQYAKEINYPYLMQVNSAQLSKCYEFVKDFEHAYEYLKISKMLQDSIAGEEKHRIVTWLEKQFDTERKNKIIAEQAYSNRIKNILIVFSIFILGVVILFFVNRYKQIKIRKEQEKERELQNQRDEISRDLHDNIGANLTFISSTLDYYSYKKPSEKDIQFLSVYTKETIKELRQTVKSLMNTNYNISDLCRQIDNLLNEYKLYSSTTQITFEKNISDCTINSVMAINIFRVIKEAINNAVKHAHAKNIGLKFTCENNQINIEITDDGKGFDVFAEYTGNGLRNMKARINKLNGTFNITSEKNKGTQISIQLKIR